MLSPCTQSLHVRTDIECMIFSPMHTAIEWLFSPNACCNWIHILSKCIFSPSAYSPQLCVVTKCIFALSAYCPRMHILSRCILFAKCKISQNLSKLSKSLKMRTAIRCVFSPTTYCGRVHALSKCMLSRSACYSYIQVHASYQLMHTRSYCILPDALLFTDIECICNCNFAF